MFWLALKRRGTALLLLISSSNLSATRTVKQTALIKEWHAMMWAPLHPIFIFPWRRDVSDMIIANAIIILLLYCPRPVETPCNVSVPAAPMADAGERHGMTRSVAASLSDTGYCTVPPFGPEIDTRSGLAKPPTKA
jgi:hypothetical protein